MNQLVLCFWWPVFSLQDWKQQQRIFLFYHISDTDYKPHPLPFILQAIGCCMYCSISAFHRPILSKMLNNFLESSFNKLHALLGYIFVCYVMNRIAFSHCYFDQPWTSQLKNIQYLCSPCVIQIICWSIKPSPKPLLLEIKTV